MTTTTAITQRYGGFNPNAPHSQTVKTWLAIAWDAEVHADWCKAISGYAIAATACRQYGDEENAAYYDIAKANIRDTHHKIVLDAGGKCDCR